MSELIRIVVIDDDPMQLELVERALSRDGFDVVTATSIAELEEHVRTTAPKIVLMDVNMPGIPGDELVATARTACPTATVLFYSSWEASRLRAITAELGADGFISKSESAVTIAKKLRELAVR